jgi:hypothetical protein
MSKVPTHHAVRKTSPHDGVKAAASQQQISQSAAVALLTNASEFGEALLNNNRFGNFGPFMVGAMNEGGLARTCTPMFSDSRSQYFSCGFNDAAMSTGGDRPFPYDNNSMHLEALGTNGTNFALPPYMSRTLGSSDLSERYI